MKSFGLPGSAPPKALFWSTRLLEWSTVVTLHCWPLSTGKGRRLPNHPSVKEQTVGPVAAWTSKLSKQAWQALPLRLHILQMPSEGASLRGVMTFSMSWHTSKFAPHTNWVHGFESSSPRADTQPLCPILILCFLK